jgi:hypothetical protein
MSFATLSPSIVETRAYAGAILMEWRTSLTECRTSLTECRTSLTEWRTSLKRAVR